MNGTSTSFRRIEGRFRRTIVVGDVHGCFAELGRLLDEVRFGKHDLLVSVGDLLDRGPEPWEAAAFFRDSPNTAWVLGNHERRVAGVIRGTSHPAWSQLHCLSKIPPAEHEAWASYLETLPAVVETPHAIVTHGRLDPSKPLDAQEPYYTAAVGGAGVRIELDADGVPLWFHEMERDLPPGKPVCFGHLTYNRVELVPGRLYALDTAACAGNRLTTLVLPEMRLVSVPARRNHAAEARQEWQNRSSTSLRALSVPPPSSGTPARRRGRLVRPGGSGP